jgi:hypothetical protein
MPDPKNNESEADFLKRCIPQVINDGTATDQKQAAAICYSKFHAKKSMDLIEYEAGRQDAMIEQLGVAVKGNYEKQGPSGRSAGGDGGRIIKDPKDAELHHDQAQRLSSEKSTASVGAIGSEFLKTGQDEYGTQELIASNHDFAHKDVLKAGHREVATLPATKTDGAMHYYEKDGVGLHLQEARPGTTGEAGLGSSGYTYDAAKHSMRAGGKYDGNKNRLATSAAFDLGRNDVVLRQVRDDLGRMSGDHPSGTFDDGGAGYTPEPTTDTAATLQTAGISATHTQQALGRDDPAHLTSMSQADVHQKLLAVGYRHEARAGHAEDAYDQPSTAAASSSSPVVVARRTVQQNVYDKATGTKDATSTACPTDRMVTEHATQRGGTALRGYKRAPGGTQ